MGVAPRAHMRLGTVGYRLRAKCFNLLLVIPQPVMRNLLDIGRRYAAMEAEIARLNQQSAELQGKPLLFLFFRFLIRLLSYRVLSAESLAKARRERDDASLQSSQLKEKLDSTEADVRARADDAARSAREEAEKHEKAAAECLGAVANSLAGLL